MLGWAEGLRHKLDIIQTVRRYFTYSSDSCSTQVSGVPIFNIFEYKI